MLFSALGWLLMMTFIFFSVVFGFWSIAHIDNIPLLTVFTISSVISAIAAFLVAAVVDARTSDE
jgi:hypothetical protein